MAADTLCTQRKHAPKLLACLAVVTIAILALAPPSSAATHSSPRIQPRTAAFTIPSWSPASAVWTLRVWKNGKLIGSEAGTSGVLRVTIPRTVHGTIQADVKLNKRWFSGRRVTLKGGGHGHGGGRGGGRGNGGGHGHGGGGSPGSGGSPGTGTGGDTTTPMTIPPIIIDNSSFGDPGTGLPGGAAGTMPGALAMHRFSYPMTSSRGSLTPSGHSAPNATTATELSFTGTPSDSWTTGLAGVGLAFLGAFLMMRRRSAKTRQP